MRKLLVVLGACAGLLFMSIAPTASAAARTAARTAGPPSTICAHPGTPIYGTHHGNLRIRGNRYLPNHRSLTVQGNLIIAPGGCLNAFSKGTVRVYSNILVGRRAILALGCSPGALGPPLQKPCFAKTTSDRVGGNIVATGPWSMYLTAVTIGGNVVSNGGGPGDTVKPYVNFPLKENTIGGNLELHGWRGAWIGALRNTVGGGVDVSDNTTANPDSTEVATNTIGGNLNCTGNSPTAQFGDSHGTPNVVAGRKLGQCAGL